MSSTRSIVGAAVLLLQLPVTLGAQQPGAAPSGRFEQDLNPRTRVEGLTPAEAREWNATVERVAAVLRANPAVSSPPPGICTRLSTWVGEFVAGPRAMSTPTVQIPVSYDGRSCSRISNEGVTVHLNGFGQFLGIPNRYDGPEGERARLERFYVLPIAEGSAGRGARYYDGRTRWVVLTHGREPLTLAVTKEDYLRHLIAERERAQAEAAAMPTQPMFDLERWLREEKPRLQAELRETLRSMEGHVSPAEIQRIREAAERSLVQTEAALRQLATQQPDRAAIRDNAVAQTGREVDQLRAALTALSPEQRQAPACFDANELLTAMRECTGRAQPYVTLNPRYFDPSLPASAVQLIVVSSPAELRGRENPRHYELRTRIFETLDYAALAQLLRR